MTVSETVIDFGKLIVPAFYPVHRDIVKGTHTYYDLYGGRGGLKSSFISLEIVLGMMKDEQANAAIFRKYAVTLRESVYEQILWAIDVLGVSHLWEVGVSPMQCTYRPTGQKIIFRGLDKAKKTKSLKASHGYFKYLWFEELDEFQGPEEIRTVQQSVLRGGEKFVVFKSFNPPISISNWANQYVNEPRSDSYRHKSSYLDAPPEWLGQQFIDDAEEERLAKIRENAVVGSQQIVKIAERRKQLLQEIADMEAAGIGAGYQQYDLAKQEIAEIEQKIKDYNNGIKEAKENYKKLGDAVKKAFTTVGNMLKRANSLINSFGKRIKEAFSKFTKSASGATKSANGFTLSLKNILKYGFGIRSLYVLVNKLRSGIKEGFANLLTYSQVLENSVNGIKASALTLKNAFAAAFSPFVEIALPYVQKLLDYMIHLANVAGQFFAAITGRKTYIKAIKQTTEALKEETKEMNKQLSPLDKLNNLSSQKGTGADTGGAGTMFEEVPIDNSILDMAEKIKDVLAKLFAPLKEAWEREGKFVMDSWKYALDEVWKLIKDIGRDFLTVWQQEGTIKIFEDLLHIIGDIGLVVGHLARNFRDAWNENQTGFRILENIRDIIGVIVHNIRLAADQTVEWAGKLNFKPLLEAFERFTKSLIPLADALSGVLSDFYTKVLLPLAKWTVEKGLPELLDVFTAFNEKVDWQALRDNLAEFWEHLEPFAETIGEGLIIFIERVSNALADFVNSQEFKDFLVMLENWMDSVSPEDVADALEMIAKGLIALKVALLGYSAISAIAGIFTTITTFVSAISALGSIVAKSAAFIATGIEAIINTVGGIIPILATVAAAVVGWNIGSWIAEKLDLDPKPFKETMSEIKDSFTDGSW